MRVALLAEGVDRNNDLEPQDKLSLLSPSSRRAWIEIQGRRTRPHRLPRSPSSRRAWIEIGRLPDRCAVLPLPSSRRAWTEISPANGAMRRIDYAARKDAINAQKRAAYVARKVLPKIPNFNPLPEERVIEVLRKEAQSWIASLPDAERTAIQKYTYNPGDQKPNRFFERTNRMLRGDSEEDPHLRMYAERISDALKRSPLSHDILCYRAMEFNPFEGMQVGDIVCPGQFYSTSVVKSGSLKKAFAS